MAPRQNSVPLAAHPSRQIFDPCNSSAMGHQRAESRLSGSTSWRASRSLKLGEQFVAGPGGGKRIYGAVGTGSQDFGMVSKLENGGLEDGDPGRREREKGWEDVRRLLSGEGHTKEGEQSDGDVQGKDRAQESIEAAPYPTPERRPIFQNLRVYINGSTTPMVSDHRLKQLLAQHGAGISIALGRRSVTHVILGTPNGAHGGGHGAGGGLSASKIQKEIKRVGGCGVKYVGVEWVLESIKAGKRLPETRFSNLSTAAKGQKSVYEAFRPPPPPPPPHPPQQQQMNLTEATPGESPDNDCSEARDCTPVGNNSA